MPPRKKTTPGAQATPVVPDKNHDADLSELNPRQRMFVTHYAACKNATRAAKLAGYSGDENAMGVVGHRLLRNSKIAAGIEKRIGAQIEKLEISHDTVIGWLDEIRTRSMQGEPVLDREGNETGEWKFEGHAAIKSTELIGKHFGMWKNESGVNNSGNNGTGVVVDRSGVREVLRRAKR